MAVRRHHPVRGLLAAGLSLVVLLAGGPARVAECAEPSGPIESRAVDVSGGSAGLEPDAQAHAAPLVADSCGPWDPQFGLRGVNGVVRAVVRIGSDLYVAGISVTIAGSVPVTRIARWDGAQWSALGSGINGSVQTLATDGVNLYAGGTFTSAGGVIVQNIAKWDGNAWSGLGGGTNGLVETIVCRGGDVYVGGAFTRVDGTLTVARVARWNGSAWSPMGTNLGNTCHALEFMGDTLYAAGAFNTGSGSPERIAKWDGATWLPVGTGLNATARVLHAVGNELYAGGDFTMAGGGSANRIARWDGSAWSALGSGVVTGGTSVEAITTMGGALYAGGTFTTIGGVAARGVARWDGSSWGALHDGLLNSISGSMGCYDFEVESSVAGERLLAVGAFEAAGGVATRGIARWDGTAWSPLDEGRGANANILSIIAVPGPSATQALYVGGDFSTIGGIASSRVARLDLVSQTWSALGSGCNLGVRALAAGGSDLYVVGLFTLAGGVNCSRVARWNGSVWSPLGTGLNNAAESCAWVPDGAGGHQLYVGGVFTTAGGVSASRIARWNGTSWSALGSGVNGIVEEIAYGPNGHGGFDLYVAGQFTTAGGNPANRIARWDGTSWSPLGAGVDSTIDALWVEPDGHGGSVVYVGGLFTHAGGQTIPYVARWDGSQWSALGAGLDDTVHSLSMHQGALYAVGRFRTSGPDSVVRVARWDGSQWSALGRGLEPAGADAIVATDTSVFVGGVFLQAGCVPSAGFGRYSLVQPVTAVQPPKAPAGIVLAQNRPNPFRPGTRIRFTLTEPEDVSLEVHDVAGRHVARLFKGRLEAGAHEYTFESREQSAGIYFYTLRTARGTLSRSMILVR